METDKLLKPLEGTQTRVRVHFDAPHGGYERPFVGRVVEVNVTQGYYVFSYLANPSREYKVYAEFVDHVEVLD